MTTELAAAAEEVLAKEKVDNEVLEMFKYMIPPKEMSNADYVFVLYSAANS